MTSRALPATLALLLLLPAGCGEDETRVSRSGRPVTDEGGAPAAAKAAPVAAAASSSQADEAGGAEGLESPTAFIHDEAPTYRDPFRSFLEEFEKRTEGPAGEEVPRTPTEEYDVNQFKVVGIITGTPVPKAMVVDPTGFGHVIRPGDRIGRQGGRVVAIYSNEVVVQSTTPTVEDTMLYLNAPGQAQEEYQVNVVESVIETEAAQRSKAQGLLKQLDLQQLLGGQAAAAPTEGQAGGPGGAPGVPGQPGQAAPADLPAVPVLPLLPGFMIQPAGGGALGTPAGAP